MKVSGHDEVTSYKTANVLKTISPIYLISTHPGCQTVFFRSKAAIVNGEAAIEILAAPLTIAALLRKKNPLAPRVISTLLQQLQIKETDQN